jgi:hypothetical protein
VTTLTSPAALPPIITNPVAAPGGGTPLVVSILGARATGALNSPLVETLQDAAGPGNVITGTVAESAADGNVTVTTQNGSSISFHHPPELPLELGSTVVLRLLPTNSTPQAVLLAVNGRPITLRGAAGSGTPASTSPAAAAASAARPAASAPNTASVAASFIATISLEDEAAIESALDDTGLTLDAATDRTGADSVGPTVIATLIRPAPAKLGQAPVPSGTRYLVTLREVGHADAAAPVAARSAAPSGAAATTPATAASAARPAGTTALAVMQPVAASPPEAPVSAAATVLLALQQAIDPPADTSPPEPLPAAADPAEPSPDGQPPAPAANAAASPPSLVGAAETAELGPAPLDSPAPATMAPTDTDTAAPLPASDPAATEPATPSVSAADPAPATPPPEALVAFRPQITTLAGRVIAPRAPDETLVETPIGTLALPLPAPLPLGVGVQLRVTAIAPPQTAEHQLAGHAAAATTPHPELAEADFDTMPPTLVEELARVLAPAAPAAIDEIHAALALDAGDGLAAAIMTFLNGIRRAPPRGGESPARRALVEGGRKDLAERLDRASRDIGTTRPAHGPDGWNVTILPFLGPASVRPMRLYRKRHDDKDADGKPRNTPTDRFMLEVELKRMGPLQFDGLVRERRFDLVVRSREPFVPPLQRQLEQAFQDGLLITGWRGEIGFGRIGTFPMMPDPESSAHLDLGA